MKQKTIEDLAYAIKIAKDEGKPNPIFFLGAGASVTGGIPLASELVNKILSSFKDKPAIKKLTKENCTYTKVMECLSTDERKELFSNIIKHAQINVTHIYLAQLVKEGYVDYVLTTNFDDLMIRALALYNTFPAVYDIASTKNLPTSNPEEKSVIHLHGQYRNFWLLNTKKEQKEIKKIVPKIFDSIANKRTWVILGYSGSDVVFPLIANLNEFGSELYWIGHKDEIPIPRVQKFLAKPNNGSYFVKGYDADTVMKGYDADTVMKGYDADTVMKGYDADTVMKGYDADTFMMKLHQALALDQPTILANPYSLLKEFLGNIKDIENKEQFAGVDFRLKIANEDVAQAIDNYEKRIEIRIINIITSGKFEAAQIQELKEEVEERNDPKLKELLANLYLSWGWGFALDELADIKQGAEKQKLLEEAIDKYKEAVKLKKDYPEAYNSWGGALFRLADIKEGAEKEALLEEAIGKFKEAVKIKKDFYEAYNNWGTVLFTLAELKEGNQKEVLLKEASGKYKEAVKLKEDYPEAYNNWGSTLDELAELKEGNQKEALQKEAMGKYKEAVKIKKDYPNAYNNWGIALGGLAELKEGAEKEALLEEAIGKFKEAVRIKEDYPEAYYNWGLTLFRLADIKKGAEKEALLEEVMGKYREAVKLKEDYLEAYNNWGVALLKLAQLKSGEEAEKLYQQAEKVLKKGIEYGSRHYNYACLLALTDRKAEALHHLDISLTNQEVAPESVVKESDWKSLIDDPDFKALIQKHSS